MCIDINIMNIVSVYLSYLYKNSLHVNSKRYKSSGAQKSARIFYKHVSFLFCAALHRNMIPIISNMNAANLNGILFVHD